MCHYCITIGHIEQVHNSVKVMAKKHRKEIEKMVEPVDEMITRLSQKVVAAGEKITVQKTEIDQQIDLYYDKLHQQLHQQREELKKKLRERSSQEKKKMSLHLEQIDFAEAHLKSVRVE